GRLQAIVPATQVEQFEFVCGRIAEFRQLDIYAPDPVAAFLEILDQMASDKAARTGNQYFCFVPHLIVLTRRKTNQYLPRHDNYCDDSSSDSSSNFPANGYLRCLTLRRRSVPRYLGESVSHGGRPVLSFRRS